MMDKRKVNVISCFNSKEEDILFNLLEKKKLNFEELYKSYKNIYEISNEIKKENNSIFYKLPFCHTLEANNLGANIEYLYTNRSPRISGFNLDYIDKIKLRNSLDYNEEKIKSVIDAIKDIKKENGMILYELSGHFSILNSFIETKDIYKHLRKDNLVDIFKNISVILLDYVKLLVDLGVDIISYSDPMGSIEILGPNLSNKKINAYLIDFLDNLKEITKGKSIVHICPKIKEELNYFEKIELIELKDINVEKYEDFFISLKEKSKGYLFGSFCIKKINEKYFDNDLVLIKLL